MSQLFSKEIFGDSASDFELHPLQATGVQWMRWIEHKMTDEGEMPGGILADDMGFGKTRMIAALMDVNEVPSTMGIIPLNTLPQTAREILKLSSKLRVYKINEYQYISRLTLREEDGIEYIHPERLYENRCQTMIPPFVLLINKEKFSSLEYQRIINRFMWFRVFIDEGHVIRNGDSTKFYDLIMNIQQPQVTLHDGRRVRLGSRFIVSGTPIQNDITDLIWEFRWIDNRSFQNSKIQDEELRTRVRFNLFRRSKDQITSWMKRLMNFPEKPAIHETVSFSLKGASDLKFLENIPFPRILENLQRREFAERVSRDEKAFIIVVVSEIYHNIREMKTTKRVNDNGFLMNSLRIKLSYPFRDPLPGTGLMFQGVYSKIEEIRKLVRRHHGESMVIFHHFSPIREAAKEELSSSFPDYVIREINGDQKVEERDKTLMRCNADIDNDVPVILFSSIKATAEGLNYQKFRITCLVDQDPNPQQEMQIETRVYRIGQTKQVINYTLYMEPFQCYHGSVAIDRRLTEIKDEKKPLARFIDDMNAAHTFRRYTMRDEWGRPQTGVSFGSHFESQPRGSLGGPDSIGPEEIC